MEKSSQFLPCRTRLTRIHICMLMFLKSWNLDHLIPMTGDPSRWLNALLCIQCCMHRPCGCWDSNESDAGWVWIRTTLCVAPISDSCSASHCRPELRDGGFFCMELLLNMQEAGRDQKVRVDGRCFAAKSAGFRTYFLISTFFKAHVPLWYDAESGVSITFSILAFRVDGCRCDAAKQCIQDYVSLYLVDLETSSVLYWYTLALIIRSPLSPVCSFSHGGKITI